MVGLLSLTTTVHQYTYNTFLNSKASIPIIWLQRKLTTCQRNINILNILLGFFHWKLCFLLWKHNLMLYHNNFLLLCIYLSMYLFWYLEIIGDNICIIFNEQTSKVDSYDWWFSRLFSRPKHRQVCVFEGEVISLVWLERELLGSEKW